MEVSFGDLWQREQFSDVDVLITACAPRPPRAARAEPEILASFPGHNVFLSRSPYLEALVLALRWQRKRPHGEPAGGAATVDQLPSSSMQQERQQELETSAQHQDGDSISTSGKAQLVLELQDASWQPAALVVLASMYLVKPLPELLSELHPEQQLQAAVLADQWQVPNVSTAAIQLLGDALKSEGEEAETVKQQLLQHQALPDCLQPLLKSTLLLMLRDLEAVWADPHLQEQLLGLSLHSMQLLLSCDELQVSNEDTVLYTAQRYTNNIKGSTQRGLARQQLAPLIRCPRLSRFWQSASVNSTKAGNMLLTGLRPLLQRLLLVREGNESYKVRSRDLVQGGLLEGAPASWALGRRAHKTVHCAETVWQLDVSKLRQAAQRSAAAQTTVTVRSPCTSPPLGGMAFSTGLYCQSCEGGASITFACWPLSQTVPADVCVMFDFSNEVVGLGRPKHSRTTLLAGRSGGISDFFDTGVMAGGWDVRAWAAKGLPTCGQLVIKTKVWGLAHVPASLQP